MESVRNAEDVTSMMIEPLESAGWAVIRVNAGFTVPVSV